MTNPAEIRSTTLIYVGLLALLLTVLASCGPGGGTEPPANGDTSVNVTVTGPGRVVQGDFDCTGSCTWTGDGAEPVTFQAVPSPGNVLVAWGGVCPVLAEDCTRTFEDGEEIAVTFAPHALRLDLTGDGIGTVVIAGPLVNTTCGGDCGIAFSRSLNHLITINASGRTELAAWSGSCEGADEPNFCYVSPTGATDVGKTWTHPPLALDDAYTAFRNTPLIVDSGDGVLENDDDTADDTLTAVVNGDGPSDGTLDLANDGAFTYTPDDAYLGPDAFSYVVRDAYGNEDRADVTIEVTNRAPVVNLDRYETDRNTPITIDAPGVLANDSDPDGDTITAVLVDTVEHGTLTLGPEGGFSYEPATDYAGPDAFTYIANDGNLDSNPATVSITVDATNRAPTAEADAYDLFRNDTLTVDAANGVLANDDDLDDDPLQAQLIDDVPTGEGKLTLSTDGSFTYDPNDFVGTTQFTYQASDGLETSATTTVTIDVINRAPITTTDTYAISRGGELSVAAAGVLDNDTDPDGDTLTAVLVPGSEPATGTLNLAANGGFTYTPDGDYVGNVQFQYEAFDGEDSSDPTTVTIDVTNTAPTAVDDPDSGTYETDRNTPITIDAPGVLNNDSDPDSDPLTATKASEPSHGTVTVNTNGSFTYEPETDYAGPDAFTYIANDGNLDSNPATVSITVVLASE